MRKRTQSTLALALAVAGLASCATTKQSAGLQRADDLVGTVELVHLEAELARQQIYDTLSKLHGLVAPGFEGDPLVAYEAFATSVMDCEQRALALRNQRAAMASAAGPVFARWEASLDAYRGSTMRQRAARRLDEARVRYESVVTHGDRAQEGFDAFTAGMQDMALFLGLEFNPSSTAEIEGDARVLAQQAQGLRDDLGACMRAAATYVREAAPLGQVEIVPTEPEQTERPTTPASPQAPRQVPQKPSPSSTKD